MLSRRTFILALSLSAVGVPGTASAEFMTEAERRAQLTALAERSTKPQVVADRKAATPEDVRREPNAFTDEVPGTIVIRTGNKSLHYIEDTATMVTYPIAVGREGAQWFGTTNVVGKRKNPEWRPTPNMRRRDPKLPAVVRPGPRNPLGTRAIYLAQGYLRIHGTNAPSSIGKAASSGCYRMHNRHVEDLFEIVSSGAKVIVLR